MLERSRNEDMVELIEKVRHAAITAGSFNFADVKVETAASMVAAKASPKI